MRRGGVLLRRDAGNYWRGIPWRQDPVPTDHTYWTADRYVEMIRRHCAQLRDSLGRQVMKNFVRVHQKARAGTFDQHMGGTLQAETQLSGFTYGADMGVVLGIDPHGPHTVDSFTVQTDQLIGGHSEAFIDETEDNTLLFHGTLRVTRDPVKMTLAQGKELLTEEHVGFAAFEFCHSLLFQPHTAGCRGYEIRCRGSMHPFHVKLHYSGNSAEDHYYHMFVPTDEWRNYVLRYDHFRKTVHGSEVPTRNGTVAQQWVHTNTLKRFIVGISIGEEEDFWLEIEYVRHVTMTPEELHQGQKFMWETTQRENSKFG